MFVLTLVSVEKLRVTAGFIVGDNIAGTHFSYASSPENPRTRWYCPFIPTTINVVFE